MNVDCIGPFGEHYRVTVDGYEVPHLTALPTNPQKTEWHISLDGRYSLELSEERLHDVLWFVANAMAVAAGFTSHGENSIPANPYHRRLIGLSTGALGEMTGQDDSEWPDAATPPA